MRRLIDSFCLANMALALIPMLLLAGLASAVIPEDGCPPGSFVNGIECEICPIGTYQPDQTFEGQREACKTCTSGHACGTSGLDKPDDSCDRGYYCPQGSISSTALPCPLDFYCESYTMSIPFPCPPNTRSGPASTALFDCKPIQHVCKPGQYGSGSPYCSDCPSGTFQPSWLYSSASDHTTCQPCPVGQYCGSPGLAAPTGPCVSISRKYCPMRSTSRTGFDCPEGFYCPANNTGPIPCPAGTTSGPSAGDVSECLPIPTICPPGTYKNGPACGLCAIGTYQHDEMAVDGLCNVCEAGHYCIYNQASSMTGKCQAGYSCPERSTMPTQALCPEHHYCPAGTGNPMKCPDGTISQKGETSIAGCIDEDQDLPDVNCGPGTYTNSSGECVDCPVGTYQPGWSNGKGIYICKYCDEGKYCKSPGLAAPSGSCALGFYCPIRSTKRTEEICPHNHYCPSGQSMPIACPSGTSSEPGSTDVAECTDYMECQSGSSSNGVLCEPCGEGTYKADVGSNDCLPCPEGKHCPGLGTIVPRLCSPGYYCTKGSSSPIQSVCPANYYCPSGSKYACYSSYRSYPGSIDRTDCSSSLPKLCSYGYFFEYGDCSPCPAGYYKPVSDRSGVNSCLPCPEGYFCVQGSPNPSVKCQAGYFCPFASGGSIICPVDHYCPEGSSEAIPCPAGKQSPAGSSSC